MGTRSLTIVKDENEQMIMAMYRQMDGYYEGHGKELADFLTGFRLVNGIGLGDDQGKVANGLGCLAAQIVAHFKTEVGGIYLIPPENVYNEEYVYYVSGVTGGEPDKRGDHSKNRWNQKKYGNITECAGCHEAYGEVGQHVFKYRIRREISFKIFSWISRAYHQSSSPSG